MRNSIKTSVANQAATIVANRPNDAIAVEQTRKTVLITGGATRLGAATARLLHAAAYDIVIHYRNSADKAEKLAAEFNSQRQRSATLVQGDLLGEDVIPNLVAQAAAFNQRLDA